MYEVFLCGLSGIIGSFLTLWTCRDMVARAALRKLPEDTPPDAAIWAAVEDLSEAVRRVQERLAERMVVWSSQPVPVSLPVPQPAPANGQRPRWEDDE